jgi:AcrR family transcriptional regulator
MNRKTTPQEKNAIRKSESLLSTAFIVPFEDSRRTERSDAVENRRRILAVAEKLFNKHGVANVNMADIAKAAGVGQGTLYRRFANKAELCLALLDTQMSEFQDEVLSTLREMSHKHESHLSQLIWFLDALVIFSERHSPLLCAAQHEMRILAPVPPDSSPFQWQRMTVSGLLNAAISAGEAKRDLDIPVVADALLAPLNMTLFDAQRRVYGYSLERISAGLKQLVMGLRV